MWIDLHSPPYCRKGRHGDEQPLGRLFHGSGPDVFFGLGTVPALFLVAKLADLSWLKARDIIYKFGSIFMVLTGIYFVIRGIRF